ncbi:MAG: flagellar assembly protein FliW [Bacillota bacterium]
MELQTSRFGALVVADEKVLRFPDGLYGFEQCRQFVLLDLGRPDSGFFWLQSLDDGELAFILVNPLLFAPDYELEPVEEDLVSVGASTLDQTVVMALVSVPEDFRLATANLQAPLLINPDRRLGRQIITGNPAHALKHPVFQAPKPAAAPAR